MIDLIIWAADEDAFTQYGRDNGFYLKNPDTLVYDTDPDSKTFGDVLETIDNGWRQRDGFEYTPWSGSGAFTVAKPVFDEKDPTKVKTPKEDLGGVVYLVRISGDFYLQDKLEVDPSDPDKDKQEKKSKLVKTVKEKDDLKPIKTPKEPKVEGVPLPKEGLGYIEADGVRIYDPADVALFTSDNGIASHEWLGGNTY